MMGSGNYAVEVTDANGCTGTKEFAIGSWEAPDVSLTTPSPTGFCNNSLFVPMVALTNADADYTFQWFQDGVLIPGATGVNYSSNQYANFTVQATNSHGCSNFAGPIRLFEYCGGGGQCTGQYSPSVTFANRVPLTWPLMPPLVVIHFKCTCSTPIKCSCTARPVG